MRTICINERQEIEENRKVRKFMPCRYCFRRALIGLMK